MTNLLPVLNVLGRLMSFFSLTYLLPLCWSLIAGDGHAELFLDAMLATTMLLSVLFMLRHLQSGRRHHFWLSALFGGLAFLTKSPAAVLAPWTIMALGWSLLQLASVRPVEWQEDSAYLPLAVAGDMQGSRDDDAQHLSSPRRHGTKS